MLNIHVIKSNTSYCIYLPSCQGLKLVFPFFHVLLTVTDPDHPHFHFPDYCKRHRRFQGHILLLASWMMDGHTQSSSLPFGLDTSVFHLHDEYFFSSKI